MSLPPSRQDRKEILICVNLRFPLPDLRCLGYLMLNVLVAAISRAVTSALNMVGRCLLRTGTRAPLKFPCSLTTTQGIGLTARLRR